MSSLTSFLSSDFNTQRDQWEKALLAELKLPEIGSKAHKKQLDGSSWPTLSLSSPTEIQLNSTQWKKASTTYAALNDEEILDVISEDLKAGVRNFFIHAECLTPFCFQLIEKLIFESGHAEEVEIILLGGEYKSQKIKVISQIFSGKAHQEVGGHSVHELALMAKELISGIEQLAGDIHLGVYVDSHFFHNIAKIRAAKLLALKILEETGKSNEVKVIALTSYTEWTLYERYSNILRNETAVASAFIGGADHIQSSGYNTIFEIEASEYTDKEHSERSIRMARNTSHILALESMLGVVEDAAFGSYHLESLTNALCEESWKLMQRLLTGEDISRDVSKTREQRLQMLKTRKLILSGTNDFPDVNECLNLKLKSSSTFRVARVFEDLRLKVESLTERPQVYVALYGDYGQLNGRLNFVKNYFELLGLKVLDPGHSEMDFTKTIDRKEFIVVLCSQDDAYPGLIQVAQSIKAPYKFIAGKFEMPGFQNLFGGQDIFSVLESLVVNLTKGKS